MIYIWIHHYIVIYIVYIPRSVYLLRDCRGVDDIPVVLSLRKTSLCLNFSHVCPEPVLVKRSFQVLKWLQKRVFRTAPRSS